MFTRGRVLGVLGIAAIVSGCSGFPRALPPTPAQVRPDAMPPQAKQPTKLYVTGSAENSVNVFSVPGYTKIESITRGISYPGNLWVDKSGDLYVVNRGSNVTEYASGGHAPICSYHDSLGAPNYVTTDDENNVYMTSTGPGYDPHTSYLDEFAQCGKRLRHYAWPGEPPFVYAAGVAVDADSDIFVAIAKGFVEFKNGAKQPTKLGAHVSWLPHSLLIDGKKTLIAADSELEGKGEIYTIAPPYRSARVLVKGSTEYLSLNHAGSLLYSGYDHVVIYAYPSGKLIKRLNIPTQAPAGTAISPDASF